MALKRSKIRWEGKACLRGESIRDLDAYLRKRLDPPEPDDRFVHPVCKQCGGKVFALLGGDDAIARVCVKCVESDDEDTCERAIHYICDSEEHW